MSECVKTIVLKIYKPTSKKKVIIDEAMINYSRAYQFLLDKAYEDMEAIIEKYADSGGRFKGSYITKWINGDIDKTLNKFNIEPFKDSIKIDFSASLAGYLNLKLKDNSVGYPFAYIERDDFQNEYYRLLDECSSDNVSANIEHKISKLISKTDNLRTLFFCRYSTNRNYSILYDPEKDRYFAKIYLMNAKNDKRQSASKIENKELLYISKEEKQFTEGRSRRCFLLFPLSFGRWQENYLKDAIKNPETLKTARLFKRKNEYFLSINIVMNKIETIDTENYMGISRGMNTINYSIVNIIGSELSSGDIKITNKVIDLNDLHVTANSLLKTAYENRCRIIVERLTDKGDNLTWTDKNRKVYSPLMNLSAYNQLCSVLSYKALELGLPMITRVSSVSIFYTCPFCGSSSKANRFSSDRIICISCGMSMDINKVGSLNLARKLIMYNKDTIKIVVEDTDKGLKFTNLELDLEYYPTNPYDCVDEFMGAIDNLIKDFYDNIGENSKKNGYKRKFSLIKKIEANRNIFELMEK